MAVKKIKKPSVAEIEKKTMDRQWVQKLRKKGGKLPEIPPDKYCNGRNKAKTKYCAHESGWGTSHDGKGYRCRLHGGASTGRPIKHGAYATAIPETLQYLVDQGQADPIEALMQDLDALGVFLKFHSQQFDDGDITIEELQTNFQSLFMSKYKIMNTLRRITREQDSISPAELHLFMSRFLERLRTIVDDPEIPRQEIVVEIGEAMKMQEHL